MDYQEQFKVSVSVFYYFRNYRVDELHIEMGIEFPSFGAEYENKEAHEQLIKQLASASLIY